MCFEISSGKHVVEMSFFPAGMKTGIIVSVSGAVMFAAMIVIRTLIGNKKKIEESDNE